MEWFNPQSKIDFMGLRRWTALFSLLIFTVSVTALCSKGLMLGLDFTGGTQIEISYQNPADLEQIRKDLAKGGFNDANSQVVSYGSSRDVLVSLSPQEGHSQASLVDSVMKQLPGATYKQVVMVGPQVGHELATKGALAIVISMLGTMIYVAMRFEIRFAFSAIIALIHDPVLILGIFSLWHIPFDLKALAALLAVIGYSLNDTIVVFDRVRENFRKRRSLSPLEVMNVSINQTLSRTVMTSLLTLFVVVALFLFGGASIHGFALALMIGIIIGTYSSIYVAGALAVSMGLKRQDFLIPKRPVDASP